MDIANVKGKIKPTVKNILIVDFIEAINESKPELIADDFTQLDLDNLYVDYEELITKELSHTEKEIEEVNAVISVTTNLLKALYINPLSGGVIEALRGLDHKLDDKPTVEQIQAIIKSLEEKKGFVRYLKNTLPVNENKNKNGKINIYKSIAELSVAIGFNLKYTELTIIGFVEYLKTLKDKK